MDGKALEAGVVGWQAYRSCRALLGTQWEWQELASQLAWMAQWTGN